MLSPRPLVRGNPARAKFAAENTGETTSLYWDDRQVPCITNTPVTMAYNQCLGSEVLPAGILSTISMCKIARNHGWSNGPPMVALWVVRSILGGLLKIQVNSKLLHHWHMDFRMFSFVDHTLLCWKLISNKIKASWKTSIILWWQKILVTQRTT